MALRIPRALPGLDAEVRRARRLEVGIRRPPRLGMRVPSALVRVVLGAVCVAVAVVQLPGAFWIILGVLLGVLGAAIPRSVLTWLLILLLGLSEALRGSGGGEWRFLVLLAGVHAIAVLGSLATALPATGIVQLRVLWPPLRRFLVIQVVAQAVAIATIALMPSARHAEHVGIPALAIVGACAFAVVVLLVVAPLLRGGARQ